VDSRDKVIPIDNVLWHTFYCIFQKEHIAVTVNWPIEAVKLDFVNGVPKGKGIWFFLPFLFETRSDLESRSAMIR